MPPRPSYASLCAITACSLALTLCTLFIHLPKPRAPHYKRPTSGELEDEDTPDAPNRVLRKAETVLRGRTGRLAVVIEKTNDVHNYTAVLRTAEALGVQHVHMICPPLTPGEGTPGEGTPGRGEEAGSGESGGGGLSGVEGFDNFVTRDSVGKNNFADKNFAGSKKQSKKKNKKVKPGDWVDDEKEEAAHNAFARTAVKWLTVHEYTSTAACLEQLKKDGYEVWATDLGQEAVSLGGAVGGEERTELVFPNKLAIVFGTEATGCTDEMLSAADERVYLPLTGFADSLNLSVAAALVLQRLFSMDPTLVGAMDEKERHALRRRWYGALARSEEKGREYEEILDSGRAVRPFRDSRRAKEHRGGWNTAKVVKRNEERYEAMKRGDGGASNPC